MEAAFALILPLVAGFLYISGCNQLRYKQVRDDGHRLYFRIAYFGLLLFVVTALSLGIVYWSVADRWIFPGAWDHAVDSVRPLLKEPDKAAAQLAFFLICVASVCLGRCLPFLENWLYRKRTERYLFDAASGDDLELLLLEAAVEYKSIAVTTDSGKVYVGLVLQTGEPKTDRRVIALLPFMSGYRTETGKVIFTTFYDEVYSKRGEEDAEFSPAEDFRLALPIDKMVSVSFFDLKVYVAFNSKTTPQKPRRLSPNSKRR